MNKYLVAIGGGEIGQLKTLQIDREIVSLVNKKQPKLLFIPTASGDAPGYIQTIEKIYGEKLGCNVDALLLLKTHPIKEEIKIKILQADIIYVGGGNTLMMMKVWRRLGIDTLFQSAYNKGTVLCGISAGAICWFQYGHSDSISFYQPDDWEYIRVKGLGFFHGLACPHYDGQTRSIKRKNSFKEMVNKVGGTGIAIENHAAILFRNNTFRVLCSKKGAKAFKLYKSKGQVVSKSIKPKDEFSTVELLYMKS